MWTLALVIVQELVGNFYVKNNLEKLEKFWSLVGTCLKKLISNTEVNNILFLASFKFTFQSTCTCCLFIKYKSNNFVLQLRILGGYQAASVYFTNGSQFVCSMFYSTLRGGPVIN